MSEEWDEEDPRPQCTKGMDCYRTAQVHLEKFKHPIGHPANPKTERKADNPIAEHDTREDVQAFFQLTSDKGAGHKANPMFEKQEKPAPVPGATACPSCGAQNTSKFCKECGIPDYDSRIL
eukprot:g17986.t1